MQHGYSWFETSFMRLIMRLWWWHSITSQPVMTGNDSEWLNTIIPSTLLGLNWVNSKVLRFVEELSSLTWLWPGPGWVKTICCSGIDQWTAGISWPWLQRTCMVDTQTHLDSVCQSNTRINSPPMKHSQKPNLPQADQPQRERGAQRFNLRVNTENGSSEIRRHWANVCARK